MKVSRAVIQFTAVFGFGFALAIWLLTAAVEEIDRQGKELRHDRQTTIDARPVRH